MHTITVWVGLFTLDQFFWIYRVLAIGIVVVVGLAILARKWAREWKFKRITAGLGNEPSPVLGSSSMTVLAIPISSESQLGHILKQFVLANWATALLMAIALVVVAVIYFRYRPSRREGKSCTHRPRSIYADDTGHFKGESFLSEDITRQIIVRRESYGQVSQHDKQSRARLTAADDDLDGSEAAVSTYCALSGSSTMH